MHYNDLTTSLLAFQQSVEVVFIAKASTVGKSFAPASANVVKNLRKRPLQGPVSAGRLQILPGRGNTAEKKIDACNASPIKN